MLRIEVGDHVQFRIQAADEAIGGLKSEIAEIPALLQRVYFAPALLS